MPSDTRSPVTDTGFHLMDADDAARRLGTDPYKGLEPAEAARRLGEDGPNRITARRQQGPLVRFLLQFHQPLIYILVVSGGITVALGEWVDAGVIFGVVVVNAVVGFIQESKAVNALAALARTMTAEAVVVRGGRQERIPAEELVAGDLVLLQSGDKVPADLRLVQARELRIDESALTGESVAVDKSADPMAADAPVADRSNMAYASTLVTYGRGSGIVTATGDRTEVGKISTMIATADELATPLTRKIAAFSHVLLYVILGLAGVTVAVGLWRGESLFDMFLAAVALAVGAIPEGLPAAVTITLAIGVGRMAARKAIIRRLPAVETLGSTTVICSDKTGTLTENQMTVQEIVAGGLAAELSGVGYDPRAGRLAVAGGPFDPRRHPALAECLRAGLLCNESRLAEEDGAWSIDGDPTEGALLVAAVKAGLDPAAEEARFPRLDILPFESAHQYMATLHGTGTDGSRIVYLKGSVEAVLARCATRLGPQGEEEPLDAAVVHRQVEELAAKGLRVLAFARLLLDGAAAARLDHDTVREGLCFIGLQAMIDPPRPEAAEAVRVCRRAGIQVKMITGDHAATAAAIAARIGLTGGDDEGRQDQARPDPVRPDPVRPVPVLTGQELAALGEQELAARVEETAVFARVAPDQKLRLVRALQARGHVVAMTGDGVNDAPALKQADIGVAMGITGTEVAREAADMVLTDDNFSSIEAAVEEGRGVFDNLTKFIVWTLPTNLGEGLVIMTAIFLGATLPILPVQILWINMTTAGFLGLMLAFEPKEPFIMDRPPRDPATPILTRPLILRILLVGFLLLVAAFGLFEWELARGASLAEARTVAVNVFVVMELCYLFNCRSLSRSVLRLGLLSNPWVLAGSSAMFLLQLAYTYLPVMQQLFASAAIGAGAWARIAAAGLFVYLVVEGEKRLLYRRRTG